jgi:DNA-binding NarL/FixJ family response regulator
MAIRILIADDEVLLRQALRSLIESHEGWEVCGEAEDGDEAVAKAAVLSPDAIILDLAMPRMDGFEVARHIRKAAPIYPLSSIPRKSRPKSNMRHRSWEFTK